jgi:glycosyltransferase involved in cell wall biosynthesis
VSIEVALAHDYLTQRGGAERVVLEMLRAFPGAPLYTSLYEPADTFPEFAQHDVRVSPLNAVGAVRRHHRAGLPLYPFAFARLRADADVVLCSSSGWAHGIATTGRKVVYCHNPPRWLYQAGEYLGVRRGLSAAALAVLGSPLRAWDRRAARSADRYLVNSTAVRDRVRVAYGVDATVVPPPPGIDPDGPVQAVPGVEPGFVLCVSRLLPYKHVDAVVAAAHAGSRRLIVVGDGPEAGTIRGSLQPGSMLLAAVDDAKLRWLYANCLAVVSASHEDFGLTPLEAASLGRPSVVLRAGGFLDTVIDGETGIFFDDPEPVTIDRALREAEGRSWSSDRLLAHARRFAPDRFAATLQRVVADVAAQG